MGLILIELPWLGKTMLRPWICQNCFEQPGRKVLGAISMVQDESKALRHIVIFLGFAFLCQAIALSVIRTGTSYDGTEQLLYTQYFDWGYGRGQPPLYTWLLISFHSIFGVTQLAENLLKFSLMFGAFFTVRTLTIKLGFSAAIANTVMLALFLVPEIGWEAQRNYSHSVLLIFLIPLFGLAYLRTREDASVTNYAFMGLAAGLLLLSKYNAILLIVTLPAVDLWLHRQSSIFARPKAWIALAAFLAPVIPHLLWLVDHFSHVLVMQSRFDIHNAGNPFFSRVQGVGQYLAALLGTFAAPIIFIMWFMRTDRSQLFKFADTQQRKTFLFWGLLSLIIALTLVLISGATQVKSRWLLPSALPILPVLIGQLIACRPDAMKPIQTIGLLAALILFPAQWLESTLSNPRSAYNYADLSRILSAQTDTNQLVFYEYEIFANLKLYDQSRILFHQAIPQNSSPTEDKMTALWANNAYRERVLGLARQLGFCAVQDSPKTFRLISGAIHKRAEIDIKFLSLTRQDCD